MANAEVTTRALKRAAELLGGPEALARKIECPEVAIRMWLAGKPMPPQVFLCAVDIIIDSDIEALNSAHRRKEA